MKRLFFILIMVILLTETTFAYKNTKFENLSHLLHHTDIIVLAKVINPKTEELLTNDIVRAVGTDKFTKFDFHIENRGSGLFIYELEFVYNVRGRSKLGKHLVNIYPENIPDYHPLIPGQKVILLLKTGATYAGKPILMNTAITHSVMPASPNLDISKLKGLSEREQIHLMLNDYIQFKKDELSKIRKDITKIK